MAEKMWADISEAIEIEMGETKLIVVEDRDGHVPLVRTKHVDQYIKYFQTKGRKQFQIWLDRYAKYKDLISILKEHEMPEEFIYLAMIESDAIQKHIVKQRHQACGSLFIHCKRYGLNRDWYRDERRDPEKATYAACLERFI